MIRILHTNDMHGTLNDEVFAQLCSLRNDCDVYFDSGDCIKTGNLGIPLKPDPVWEKFGALSLDGLVIGNRETHPLKSAHEMKIKGSNNRILTSNMMNLTGQYLNLNYSTSFAGDGEGMSIGVFGVMVPMMTEQRRDKALWAYRWRPPVEVAIEVASKLRPEVELLIALTHIGYHQDLKLAEACPEIDIILGGHSHTVLMEPVLHNGVYICQGGSHNRFAGVYDWEDGVLTGGLRTLTRSAG